MLLVSPSGTMAAYALHDASVTDRSPVALRHRELRTLHANTASVAYGKRPSGLAKLIAQLGGFMPAAEGSDAMRTGLVRAGYRRAGAPPIFLGSKGVCAGTVPLLWVAVGAVTRRPVGHTPPLPVLLPLLRLLLPLPFLGFYVPTFFIAIRQRQRYSEIVASLPDALDLMVVCVESGLGLGAALQRVGVEIRLASSQLSDELSLVNQEMQTGVARTDA